MSPLGVFAVCDLSSVHDLDVFMYFNLRVNVDKCIKCNAPVCLKQHFDVM